MSNSMSISVTTVTLPKTYGLLLSQSREGDFKINVRQAINCIGHQLIGFWGGALTFFIQRNNLLKLSIKRRLS